MQSYHFSRFRIIELKKKEKRLFIIVNTFFFENFFEIIYKIRKNNNKNLRCCL